MRYLHVYTLVQALVEAQGQPWVCSTFFEARSPTEPEADSFNHTGSQNALVPTPPMLHDRHTHSHTRHLCGCLGSELRSSGLPSKYCSH